MPSKRTSKDQLWRDAHAHASKLHENRDSVKYRLALSTYLYEYWVRRDGAIALEYKRIIKELKHALDA